MSDIKFIFHVVLLFSWFQIFSEFSLQWKLASKDSSMAFLYDQKLDKSHRLLVVCDTTRFGIDPIRVILR